MGRPPIGKVAMTVAERVRRYRAKHGTEKPVTKHVTKPSALDGGPLAARIRELEAELARERIAHMRTCAKYEAKLKVRRSAGLWTRSQYNAVMYCLHPDQRDKRTEAQRDAACRIVTASEPFIVLKKDRAR